MSKNTHLEHLEDDIFNNGYAGAPECTGVPGRTQRYADHW